MADEIIVLLKKLIDDVHQIYAFSSFRWVVKKQCRDLSRRLKLLLPLFEEIIGFKEEISPETVNALLLFKDALESAKNLLRIGSRGSKIFLVLQLEQTQKKFQELTDDIEHALSEISYHKLGIPDELKEQVELIHAQFRRAKKRFESPDLEEFAELFSIYDRIDDVDAEPTIIGLLCEKLELMSIQDLQEESLALHDMVSEIGWDIDESKEKISTVLKRFEDFMLADNPSNIISSCNSCSLVSSDQLCTNLTPKLPSVPEDFRCPISLELMKDPVIICTGQTYERACIGKWLKSGHDTCPKTQQNLWNSILTPNYVLSSLISNWCEANGIEPVKRSGNPSPGKGSDNSAARMEIDALLSKLASGNIEDQRAAAGELRLLAKNNGDNRRLIAQAGAIPSLVGLCFTADTITQEHAVTALLNLSIYEDNKRSIISSEAVPGILHVLKTGSMEARENAAATVFSLSVLDIYKLMIGSLGVIPELVTLLREGSQRGKKDAATALFNLCIYNGNKVRAIRAGVVPLLMTLLTEGEMLDEALAILAMLASHPEGKNAIAAMEALAVFVKLIENGSTRNKENAAALLLYLCAGDDQHLSEALALGVMNPLLDIAENGSDRGKRKAAQLLELMDNRSVQHEVAQTQADTEADDQAQSFQMPSVVNS